MSSLSQIAAEHQRRRVELADRAVARSLRIWSEVDPVFLDAGWDAVAPRLADEVSRAQVAAARQASGYVSAVAPTAAAASLNPAAFGGVTREGREVAPELFAAVTTTKRLVGGGLGVGAAFRAGTAFLSVLVGTLVSDAGRSADSTASVAKGLRYSVRVIQPGACSRCAILAGVKGYRADFKRHPRCRCTSLPLADTEVPDGFFRSADDYFESLSPAEQNRIFTDAGAEAIRLGADPMKVVNARRGAYGVSYSARGTGRVNPGRLQPVTIGTRADGSPLQVYATREGTTSRGSFGRGTNLNQLISQGDRYRRSQSVRLMPESIFNMTSSPERARELLKKYGYIN